MKKRMQAAKSGEGEAFIIILFVLFMVTCIITLITSASTMVITVGTMMMEMMMEWWNVMLLPFINERTIGIAALGTMWNGWMLPSFINERTIGIAAFIIIGTMLFLQQRNKNAAFAADIRHLSNAIYNVIQLADARHRDQQPHPAADVVQNRVDVDADVPTAAGAGAD